MKRLFSFLFLLSFLIPSGEVTAHELKRVGSLGALLHMNPDDDPIVGEKADLFFAFRDDQKKFELQGCRCQISISRNYKELFRGSLTPADPIIYGSNVGTASFVFPKKSIYVITLFAEFPDSSRESFSLPYEVRVDRENTHMPTFVEKYLNRNVIIYLAGIIGVFLIFFFGIIKKPSKKRKK